MYYLCKFSHIIFLLIYVHIYMFFEINKTKRIMLCDVTRQRSVFVVSLFCFLFFDSSIFFVCFCLPPISNESPSPIEAAAGSFLGLGFLCITPSPSPSPSPSPPYLTCSKTIPPFSAEAVDTHELFLLLLFFQRVPVLSRHLYHIYNAIAGLQISLQTMAPFNQT